MADLPWAWARARPSQWVTLGAAVDGGAAVCMRIIGTGENGLASGCLACGDYIWVLAWTHKALALQKNCVQAEILHDVLSIPLR